MVFLDVAKQEADWEELPEYLDVYVQQRSRFARAQEGVARMALDEVGVGSGRLLEVGLGTSALAMQAQLRGLEYWCVEPYAPMVDWAVREGLVDADRAQCSPIETADLPTGYFDGVVMLMVLEHLMDPIEALRSCLRALRPGGIIYVEVPNSRVFRSRTRLRRLLGMTDFMEGHINFFTPRSLSTALSAAGFSALRPRVLSNARRGDAELMTEYYVDSRRSLRVIYGLLSRFPMDQWLGVASVLGCRGARH
ncbi:MAG: class I SAM-dependent methyltransferase [Myxococcota bacterium]